MKLRCLQLQHKLQTQQAVLATPGLGPAWDQLTTEAHTDQDGGNATGDDAPDLALPESPGNNPDAGIDPCDIPPTAQDVLNAIPQRRIGSGEDQQISPTSAQDHPSGPQTMMPSIQRPDDDGMPPNSMQFPPMGLGGMPDMAAFHAMMQQQFMHGAGPVFLPGMGPLPPDQAMQMMMMNMMMMTSGQPQQGMSQQHPNMSMPPGMHDGHPGPMLGMLPFPPSGQITPSGGHLAPMSGHMNGPMHPFMQTQNMRVQPPMPGMPPQQGPSNNMHMQMMAPGQTGQITGNGMPSNSQQVQEHQQAGMLMPMEPSMMMPFGWDGTLPVPPSVLPSFETLMAAVQQGVVLPEMMWLAGLEPVGFQKN